MATIGTKIKVCCECKKTIKDATWIKAVIQGYIPTIGMGAPPNTKPQLYHMPCYNTFVKA